MRYTVFDLEEDFGNEASGLSLEEACARLMALAECEYSFPRDGHAMRLLFTRHGPTPQFPDGELESDLNPDFRSSNPVAAEARREIMRQIIEHGIGHFCVMPDDEFQAQKAKYFAARGRASAYVPRVGSNFNVEAAVGGIRTVDTLGSRKL
jgi:hypothetical protein